MPKEEKKVSFEKNLEKLEEIVKNLESGDIPLDDAIDKFNEAMNLVKICDERLKTAEETIAKIVDDNDQLKAFKPED